MSGAQPEAPATPFTMVGAADVPVCEGDFCVIPGLEAAGSEQDA